jgi:hypothetical protein
MFIFLNINKLHLDEINVTKEKLQTIFTKTNQSGTFFISLKSLNTSTFLKAK